jgi:hypothetical protein
MIGCSAHQNDLKPNSAAWRVIKATSALYAGKGTEIPIFMISSFMCPKRYNGYVCGPDHRGEASLTQEQPVCFAGPGSFFMIGVDTHGLTPVALAKEVCIYLESCMPSNSL